MFLPIDRDEEYRSHLKRDVTDSLSHTYKARQRFIAWAMKAFLLALFLALVAYARFHR